MITNQVENSLRIRSGALQGLARMGLEWRAPRVILATMDLVAQCVRSFADAQDDIEGNAQDDTGEPIRLFLSDELMVQYFGINDNSLDTTLLHCISLRRM